MNMCGAFYEWEDPVPFSVLNDSLIIFELTGRAALWLQHGYQRIGM